jgi:predicted amidohydrolase
MPTMRVALCQMSSGDDIEANRTQAGELLDQSADGGADLAALPEVWT